MKTNYLYIYKYIYIYLYIAHSIIIFVYTNIYEYPAQLLDVCVVGDICMLLLFLRIPLCSSALRNRIELLFGWNMYIYMSTRHSCWPFVLLVIGAWWCSSCAYSFVPWQYETTETFCLDETGRRWLKWWFEYGLHFRKLRGLFFLDACCMDVGGALYSGTLFQDYISVRSYIYIWLTFDLHRYLHKKGGQTPV